MVEIDPDLIEWHPRKSNKRSSGHYRRNKRGRPVPVLATFQAGSGMETVTFWASRQAAKKALQDLELHAHPDRIRCAIIFRLLSQIAQNNRPKRHYAPKLNNVKISATPIGARALLEDLTFFTSRTDPIEIRESVAANFLWSASRIMPSKHRNVLDSIKEGMRQYGPWIHAFANRIRASTQTATDEALLDNMLRAAEKAGYPRGKFIGRNHGHRGFLPWPIEAFLIEYCLGGKQSWLDVKLKPPMKLIENDLSRQRDPSVLDSKITSIFKKYFGADWHNVVNQHLPSDYVPRPIRRLMP